MHNGSKKVELYKDNTLNNITIMSDLNSWINNYIPQLIDEFLRRGFCCNWVHDLNIPVSDIVFYLGCGQIIPPEILSQNKHNLVVHESDLPNGKGWSPLTWQVLEGRNEISIVLFEAVEKVDSGLIYLKDTINFEGTELVDDLRAKQAELTIKLCISFLDKYPDIIGKAIQQSGDGSYYRRRFPDDSRLDPDKTIREQFNLLRVVDNDRYPAYFELNGYKYNIKITKQG